MNLRLKFFWNLLTVLSVIFVLYTGIQLYKMYQEKIDLWERFNSEEIGTDKAFRNQVVMLESNLELREKAKFVIDVIPTNLGNVVAFEGSDFRFSHQSQRIRVTQIVQPKGELPVANIQYRGEFFNLVQGDSIAGGLITSITKKELIFEKDGQLIIFSMERTFGE